MDWIERKFFIISQTGYNKINKVVGEMTKIKSPKKKFISKISLHEIFNNFKDYPQAQSTHRLGKHIYL